MVFPAKKWQAGLPLKGKKPKQLAAAVAEVLANPVYRQGAQKLSETLRSAGGATEAANVIEAKIEKKQL